MTELSPQEREDFLKFCHAAQAAVQHGDLIHARIYFRRAIQIHPFSPAIWFELARILEDKNDRKTALENVLVLAPDHEQANQLLEELEPDSSA